MRNIIVKVHPSKANLKKEDQLAWKIAEISSDKSRPGADSIEMVACGAGDEGNVQIVATETASMYATKVIINSKVNTKLMSSGITEVIANSCLKMYGSIISGVSDAVAVKDSKVGGQRYQQQQSIT